MMMKLIRKKIDKDLHYALEVKLNDDLAISRVSISSDQFLQAIRSVRKLGNYVKVTAEVWGNEQTYTITKILE